MCVNFSTVIDREGGPCGVFGTQLLPPGDEKVASMIELFEQSVYEASI